MTTTTTQKAKPMNTSNGATAQRGLGAYAPSVKELEKAKQTPGQTVRIPLDLIDVPHDIKEIPVDKEKLEEIRAGFAAIGQTDEVDVRPRGPRYELLDGRHRLEAAKLCGWTDVSAKRWTLTDEEAVAFRHASNIQRRTAGAYERALSYNAMLKAGLKVAEVAERCGVSESTIVSHLKLVKLPPDIGALVGQKIGKTTVSVAHADALVPLAAHPKLLKEAVDELHNSRNDYENGRTAEDYAGDVAQRLREKNLVAKQSSYDYRRDEILRSKKFQAEIQKLPSVKIGGTVLVLDKDGFQKIEDEANKVLAGKERKETRAVGGKSSSDKARRKQLFDAKVKRETTNRIWQTLAKRVAGTVSLDDVALRALCDNLVQNAFSSRDDRARMAQLLGLPEAQQAAIEKMRFNYTRKGKAILDVVAGHAKAGTLPRLTLAILFNRVAPSNRAYAMESDEWKAHAKHWLGTDPATIESKVRDELVEAKNKKTAPEKVKPAKVKRKVFFNDLAADCPDCGMKGVSTEPDGTLREHWPKTKRDPSCKGGKKGLNLRPSGWKGPRRATSAEKKAITEDSED